MDTSGGQPSAPLGQLLLQRSHEFDFFQAVRLCLRLFPKSLEPGSFGVPSQEAIFFSQLNSFCFPPAVIHNIHDSSRDKERLFSVAPLHMTVTVLGLTGYSGLLPWFYTRLLIQEKFRNTGGGNPNPYLAEFLDCFNHRLVSLQYRAWEKHRLHVWYERRPLQLRDPNSIAAYLLALLGLAAPSVCDRLQVRDAILLGQAGVLAALPRSPRALKILLRTHFGVAVEVLQFQGRWCRLRVSEMCTLGGKGDQARLGSGGALGREIWYPQASFRIRLKLSTFKEFLAFCPGQKRFAELTDLVDFFTRGMYQEFEIELLIPEGKVPSCRLTKLHVATAPRLGWVGWLGNDRKKGRTISKKKGFKSVVFHSNDPKACRSGRSVAL